MAVIANTDINIINVESMIQNEDILEEEQKDGNCW